MKNNASEKAFRDRITVKSTVECETVEKKSRFIATLAPARDEKNAIEFISGIKKKYPDATHNVFAYYIDHGTYARYSDDGEPQGTAGMPVLNVLKMSGLTDIAVVVTRYFGGILLGAGGLVRAYSSAASSAIAASEKVIFEPYLICRTSFSYSEYQKLSAALQQIGAAEEEICFCENVDVKISVKKENFDKLSTIVADLTSGRENIAVVDEIDRPTPVI